MRRVYLLLALITVGGWAADLPSPAERLLSMAQAVLRINDPAWLDKEAARLAATLGQDPTPLRGLLARSLFRSHSLAGIDLNRPALLAWRAGSAPLLAVLPISDRRVFLSHFGEGGESPLVRTGEREGTVIFSQNDASGLSEYRLMVLDGVAFLARTAAECRTLSGLVSARPVGAAPLIFTARSAWLKALETQSISNELPAAARSQLESFRPLGGFLDQCSEVSLEVRADGAEGLRAAVHVKATPESLLAVWISNQRNQPNRLLPLVRNPASVVTVAGQVLWQGLGERFGAALLGTVKAKVGAAWTAAADEAWSGLWALSDRSGPFAAAFDLVVDQQTVASESRMIMKQPNTAQMLTLTNVIMGALNGTAGESITVRGANGYRWLRTDTDNPALATLAVATDGYLIQVQSGLRPPEQALAELVDRCQNSAAPEALNSIVTLTVDVTPLALAAAVTAKLPTDIPVQSTPIVMALTTAGPGDMALELGVPHIRIATLIRDLGLASPSRAPVER